jgi:hypothetical protein
MRRELAAIGDKLTDAAFFFLIPNHRRSSFRWHPWNRLPANAGGMSVIGSIMVGIN